MSNNLTQETRIRSARYARRHVGGSGRRTARVAEAEEWLRDGAVTAWLNLTLWPDLSDGHSRSLRVALPVGVDLAEATRELEISVHQTVADLWEAAEA